MSYKPSINFDALYRRLGVTFPAPELIELAITHRSVHGKRNNERLEFLGDSILNFIIAQELYERFDTAREGQLSQLRAVVVRGKSLALVAKDLKLGEFIRLGPGELKSGGFRRDSILADAVEAIIGAIYTEFGLEACRERVLCWFQERIASLTLEFPKDPKTHLQEYCQSKKMPLPIYDIVSCEGQSHDQIFTVMCKLTSLGLEAVSTEGSRRKAEQSAAALLIDQLKLVT